MNQFSTLNSKTTSYLTAMVMMAFLSVSTAWGYVDEYTGQKRVLMLGDSITRDIAGTSNPSAIGYQVREAFAGMANVHILAENFQDTDFALSNASAGVTHIEKWINNETWDVIDFNTGLHDMNLSSYKYDTPTSYATKLGQVIDEIQAHSGSAKLIWRETTFVPNPEGNGRHKAVDGVTATDNAQQAYNNVAAPVVAAKGITAVDQIADLSAKAERVAADNVHYTPEGYQKIALPVIENIYNQLDLPSGMRVDLGHSGTSDDLVQKDYYDFKRTSSTRLVATDLGKQNHVKMLLNNYSGSKNTSPISGAGSLVSNLLRDCVFGSNDIPMEIKISGLKPGDYTFTGYFHDRYLSHGDIDVDFSTDGGQNFSDGLETTCSTGSSPISIGMEFFQFTYNGDNDLIFKISNNGGDGVAILNGFDIAEANVPEPSAITLLLLTFFSVILRKSRKAL